MTFFAISLLVITIAAMILNAYVMETGASMEDEDDEEGESNGIPLKIPGLVLAGIEALFGLLLLIFGCNACPMMSACVCCHLASTCTYAAQGAGLMMAHISTQFAACS